MRSVSMAPEADGTSTMKSIPCCDRATGTPEGALSSKASSVASRG
jgi:hypothetical protein